MDAPLDAAHARTSCSAGREHRDRGRHRRATRRASLDRRARPGLPVGRPSALPVLHPERPDQGGRCLRHARRCVQRLRRSWLEGSGAVYAENQALRWIADLAGLPADAGGVFVQGGTVGNLSALVAAREAACKPARRQRAGPLGGLRHRRRRIRRSKHALRVVMDVDVIEIPGDERGRMTGAALRATSPTLCRHGRGRHLRRRRHRRHHQPRRRRRHRRRRRRSPASTAGGCTSTARTAAPGLAAPSVRQLFDGIERGRLVHRRSAQVAVRAVRLLRAALSRSGARRGPPTPSTPATSTRSPSRANGTRRISRSS